MGFVYSLWWFGVGWLFGVLCLLLFVLVGLIVCYVIQVRFVYVNDV